MKLLGIYPYVNEKLFEHLIEDSDVLFIGKGSTDKDGGEIYALNVLRTIFTATETDITILFSARPEVRLMLKEHNIIYPILLPDETLMAYMKLHSGAGDNNLLSEIMRIYNRNAVSSSLYRNESPQYINWGDETTLSVDLIKVMNENCYTDETPEYAVTLKDVFARLNWISKHPNPVLNDVQCRTCDCDVSFNDNTLKCPECAREARIIESPSAICWEIIRC